MIYERSGQATAAGMGNDTKGFGHLLIKNVFRTLCAAIASLALAVGLGVGLAAPAQARVQKTVWDKVAACESGSRWRINTGNGYFGGLQFSRGTWRAFGGAKYAPRADKATKAEQIAIARRVLAVQGPGAWPHCSKKAKLTKKTGKASRKAVPANNPGAKQSKKKK